MKTITREELKAKLDRGENIKLVMTMSDTAYSWLHIPGSLHFERAADAARQLSPNDEVVVYCTNPLCYYSIQAYYLLRGRGFTKVARYAGGLMDWQAAGYPLEGSLARAQGGSDAQVKRFVTAVDHDVNAGRTGASGIVDLPTVS